MFILENKFISIRTLSAKVKKINISFKKLTKHHLNKNS